MDRKQMCVSNVKYKKPTQNEAKRMKNLLGYLTYRESATEKRPSSAKGGKYTLRNAQRAQLIQGVSVAVLETIFTEQVDVARFQGRNVLQVLIRNIKSLLSKGRHTVLQVDRIPCGNGGNQKHQATDTTILADKVTLMHLPQLPEEDVAC